MTLTLTIVFLAVFIAGILVGWSLCRLRMRYAKPRRIDLSHVSLSPEEVAQFTERIEVRLKDLPPISGEFRGRFTDRGPIDGQP